jgi:hypothetical protein
MLIGNPFGWPPAGLCGGGGGGGATVVSALALSWTWLCAGTVVVVGVALTASGDGETIGVELSAAGLGIAASEDGDIVVVEVALAASADGELEALATIVTPAPAADVMDVVDVATKPAWLSVAEATLILLDELDSTTCWALGVAESLATTVIAEATVCMVLAGGTLIWLKENCGAEATYMGNALAGHAHWQLHSPFLAACSAAAAFPFPPGLATSLTGGPAADVVVVAIRPLFVGEAVLTEDTAGDALLAEPEPATAVTALLLMLAEAFDPPPPPATTVTESAVAPFAVVVPSGWLLPAEPAWTIIVAAEDTPLEEPVAEVLVEILLPPALASTMIVAAEAPPPDEATAELPVEMLLSPEPATTVTADALAMLTDEDALLPIEVLLGVVVPFPPADPWATTVIALPAVVVVVACARPVAVKLAESTAGALGDDAAASWTPWEFSLPAEMVTAAGLVPFTWASEAWIGGDDAVDGASAGEASAGVMTGAAIALE